MNSKAEKHVSVGVASRESGTIKKSVTSINSKNGTANWRITANTNDEANNHITITDAFNVTGTGSSVSMADNAILLNKSSIRISRNGNVIYENGAYKNGLSKDNFVISVTAHGFTFNAYDALPDQEYIIDYATSFDKQAYADHGGKDGESFNIENESELKIGLLEKNANAACNITPTYPISLTKSLNWSNGNAASWTITADSNDLIRRNFTIIDILSSSEELASNAFRLNEFKISMVDESGHETKYNLSSLPSGMSVTNHNNERISIDSVGFNGFTLSMAEMPAHATLSIQYSVALDKNSYLGTNKTVNVTNDASAACNDKSSANASSNATVKLEETYKKQIINIKNNKITWKVKLAMSQEYTVKELSDMASLTVTDVLNPALKFDIESVHAENEAGDSIAVTTSLNAHTVTFIILNPARYSSIDITFSTDCLETVENLTNKIDVTTSGKKIGDAEIDKPYTVKVSNILPVVQSVKKAFYTPTARKYVDHALCKDAGKYTFKITEVSDEKGTAMESAYTDESSNDENGDIEFLPISYKAAGTHFYQMKEVGPNNLDPTIFTIRVDVTREDDSYRAVSALISPNNYMDIRFDNTTGKRLMDYTVRKIWDDQNDVLKIRPDQLVVSLYQNGEPYNDMVVTLNADNHWTYTWHDLPIAGGDYEAREDDVTGYTSTIQNNQNGITLVNKSNERVMAKIVIHKAIDENYSPFGETAFFFTVTDETGHSFVENIVIPAGKNSGTAELNVEYGQNYTVKEIPVARYRAADTAIVANKNVTITGMAAIANLRNNKNAEMTFNNVLSRWNKFGHSDVAINNISMTN